jgi:hypothetical protein
MQTVTAVWNNEAATKQLLVTFAVGQTGPTENRANGKPGHRKPGQQTIGPSEIQAIGTWERLANGQTKHTWPPGTPGQRAYWATIHVVAFRQRLLFGDLDMLCDVEQMRLVGLSASRFRPLRGIVCFMREFGCLAGSVVSYDDARAIETLHKIIDATIHAL